MMQGKAQGLIQNFIQNKLSNLLESFIQFEKLMVGTSQGLTIHNSKIKPKLVQQLSQITSMPLQHISGSVSSLTLNLPWQKLFLKADTPIKIQIDGIKLRCKLKLERSQSYLMKKRERMIANLAQKLFNPLDTSRSKSSFIDKTLKQYLLNRIILEVTNISIEMQIDLQPKTQLIFRMQKCTFKKQDKILSQNQKIYMELLNFGLYYKTAGDKEVQLISPADINFQRIKILQGGQKKKIYYKNVNINKIHVHLNNYNFGNIAKAILLVKWHNRFLELPYPVWKYKPHILKQCKPFNKFYYCARLVLENVKERRFKKELQVRRRYIQLYTKLLTDTGNYSEEDKKSMGQIQKLMPVWKIIAYRWCTIHSTKLRIQKKQAESENEKKILSQKQNFNLMTNMMNAAWIKSWFSTQKNATQLQNQFMSKLPSIEEVPDQVRTLSDVKIEVITVSISIITSFGAQPFISLFGFHCEWNKKELHMMNTWQQSLQFRKCKIQFQRYLGYHQRYKNMLSESKQHVGSSQIENISEEQDEFEDINYFIEIFFTNQTKIIEIKLLPFDLVVNHQIIEKINILLNVDYLSKVPNMKYIQEIYQFYNPNHIIDLQVFKIMQKKNIRNEQNNMLSSHGPKQKTEDHPYPEHTEKTDEVPLQFLISSAANIIIPFDLRHYPQTQVLIQICDFDFKFTHSMNEINLKHIIIKSQFATNKSSQEQEGIYAHYGKQIEKFTLVKKFNAKILIQKHQNFDKNLVEISPVKFELPSTQNIYKLIELAYLHFPKKHENKVKQYFRRKQSIGQQFMDACQNLNEHINKSIILSSQKNTNRIIIKERKMKLWTILLEAISITDNCMELNIGQIELKMQQSGFDRKIIQSYNDKKINFTIKNLHKSMKIMKDINLHIKKQSIKRGGVKRQEQGEKKLNNIELLNINVIIIVQINKIKGKQASSIECLFKNIRLEQNEQARERILESVIQLKYEEENNSSKHPSYKKIALIEDCVFEQKQKYKYNLLQKQINLNSLSINIKPSFFNLCSILMKEFHIDEQAKYTLTNHTINTISIKIPPKNFYIELKYNKQCTLQKNYSEITLFDTKYILQFSQNKVSEIPKHKNQYIQVSQNNFMINKEVAPNQFILQSNIRIFNHQDKPLWIKIYQNESMLFEQAKENRDRLDSLSQFHSRPYTIDLEKEILWDSYSPTRKRMSYQKQRQGKYVAHPLKHKEVTHLLIDQDQYKFFQIIDQGKIFTQLKITDLFECTQKVIQSDDSSEQQSQYLVIRSQIEQCQEKQRKIYTFHIYSPLIIFNKTPWPLQYRISTDQISQVMEVEQKKIARRKSFEICPMKKIETLCSQKIRYFHYNQIQHMKISVNKYEREFFVFGNLVLKVKQKHKHNKGEITKERQLMTLRSQKHQIQMVLFMQFSQNIMKIVIYPQIVFINLARKQINFRIKEGEVTYHQIRLPGIQVEYHRELQKNKNKLKQWQQQQKFLNEIINLQNQKLQQREILKQLFQKYKDYIQIFTGQLNSKQMMVYQSGKEHIKKEGKSLKISMIDFVNDFGSDTQMNEMRNKKRLSTLSEEQVIKYGNQEHLIFKRYISISNSFNLVVFTPTVHIINKSQALFYAKSRSQNLVMIPKESHNFILTNEERIDIQACFDQFQEVSLTDWTQIDLQQLKTIYYAKDMIQHHGSGYESKQYALRKKKMKKMPKIFYRVITCKYQRGSKILIEQTQYPPISFINNTNDRIKIEEHKQRFLEELVNKGDMAQYAPRNPYQQPEFRLQIAQHYEYKLLTTFKVEKKQTLNLDFGIVLSIEQYKDNMIINIKTKSALSESNAIQKNYMKQILQQKNELMLEQKKQNIFSLKKMTLSIMNVWNKELNATLIQDVEITHQNKNNKDYYKLAIGKIEGYDYMSVQPEFIFHSKKDKKIFHLPTHKDKENEKINCIEFQAIIKEHKNALVIQKCQGTLRDSIFCISADLILAYVKNYYQSISNFYAFNNYYHSKRQQKKRPQFYLKKFIVQSLKWHSTSLTFKTRNLSILQTFLNKNYQKLIVKFLNWLGDLKPLSFDIIELNHVQTSLRSIFSQIDLRKKIYDFITSLMQYPLNEAKQLATLIAGNQNVTVSDKLNSIYKIFKTAEYILSWALNLNQNLKTKTKSYSQSFIEINKENNDIFDKMKKFEYCQWRYIILYPRNKLQRKIRRLQRYNTREQIQKYDERKANIKLAIDSFLHNKLHRPIIAIYVLNKGTIMSIVQEWIIIYEKMHEWTIIRVQYFLNCELTTNSKHEYQLILSYWQGQDQIEYSGIFQNKGDRVKSKTITNVDIVEFNRQTLLEFKQEIRDSILSYYY